MKTIGYLLFAFFFAVGRLFPLQQRKVVLYNGQFEGLSGNLLEVKKEMEVRQKEKRVYYFEKKKMLGGIGIQKLIGGLCFYFSLPYHMATAGQVYLNDNFLPLGFCFPDRRAQLIQLWHGAGAFKKFGLSVEQNEKVKRQVVRANRRITHLFVTSKQVVPFYSEAFGIPEERIFVTGIPITDVYFDEKRKAEGVERFYRKYPYLRDKHLLLITPTFRNTEEENKRILPMLSLKRLHEALGDEWVILLRMHPKFSSNKIPETDYCINVTGYPGALDLYLVSDMLVTDYSSTVVEYVLLDKPVVLYAYDLKDYDRGFYRDYRDMAAGEIAETKAELIEAVKRTEDGREKREKFINMQYDYRDRDSLKRIRRVLEQTDKEKG